ncbi:hypothetical protein GOV08_02930 [Candidatus Woesearchaeota archaeon]|nr:hypothetical protein [Candidatus Woesearchaeota archaeon]
MGSSIVSVRMPSSLVKELREHAAKNHFMDLSEEIRFIIKQKMQEQKDPFAHEVRKLKDEIKTEISKKSQHERTIFVEELKKLLDELKEK